MRLNIYLFTLLAVSLSFCAFSAEKEHNDKEHKKAESNLDHKHWKKAHGSGVPKKEVVRKPGSNNKKSDKNRAIRN